jgi:tetratricopeptide (TPR) repeat protein
MMEKRRPARLIPLGLLAALFIAGCGRGREPVSPSVVTSAARSREPGAGDREQELRAAVARSPEDPNARRALGEYLTGTGRPATGVWELVVARKLARDGASLGEPGSPATGALEPEEPGAVVALAAGLRLAVQLETAQEVLIEGLERHPGELALQLALGDLQLRSGDAEGVIRRVDASPEARATPEGLRLLARARYATGDAAGARAALLAARELDGPFPPAAQQAASDRLLGRLALEQGQANEARARLSAAAAVEPQDADLQYDLGRAWSLGRDAEAETKARERFLKVLGLNPRHARAAAALVRLLHERRGRWREAAAAYGKALEMDPRLVEAEEGLARVMDRLKMPGEAVYHRARAARLRARPEVAAPLYREWGRLRPERWEAPLREAQCLQEMRRSPEATRILEQALQRFPESAPLYLQLAQLYLITLAPAQAERLLPRWEPIDSNSGQPEWLRGRIAARAGRRADAIRAFEAAIAKDARQPAYALSLCEVLIEEASPENLQRARGLLEAAEAHDSSPAVPYQLGAVLAALGETEAALAAYLRCLDRDPDRVEAYGAIVPLAQRLGRSQAAAFYARLARAARRQRDELEAARRRLWERPENPAARRNLALALLRRGDLQGALDHLTAAPRGASRDLQRVRALIALGD